MNTRIFDRGNYMQLGLAKRIERIISETDITERDIDSCKENPDPLTSIQQAARILYVEARNKGYDKSQALSHITSGTLGLILGDEDSLVACEQKEARNIEYLLREEHARMEQDTGLTLTKPEVLRLQVYKQVEGVSLITNAQKAHQVYGGNVKFSYIDLIRGIKVPERIGFDEALYFGLASSGAKIESKKNSIRFYGSERDIELLSMINRHFHRHLFNAGYVGNGKAVTINSQAAVTWLKLCTDMGDSINNRRIPLSKNRKEMVLFRQQHVPLAETETILNHAYFYGIIARKSRIRKIKTGHYFEINLKSNLRYLHDLKLFSQQLGYHPTLMTRQGRLSYGKEELNRLTQAGLLTFKKFPYNSIGAFFNPYQMNELAKTT